jgi:signal transduction histidine kinase
MGQPGDSFEGYFTILERLSLKPADLDLWKALLEAVVHASGVPGGRIAGFHPRRFVSVDGEPQPDHVIRDFPLATAGKIYGQLSLFCPPNSESGEWERPVRFCAAMAGAILGAESSREDFAEFVHGATHDLRGGIVRANNFVEMLALRPLSSDQRSLCENVSRELLSSESLLREIAAYSEAGCRDDDRHPFSIRDAAEAARQSLKPDIQERHASVRWDGPDAMLNGREPDLIEIFERVIQNSLKFAGENPEVRISAQAGSGRMVIALEDNGPPFDNKYADWIFLPFSRLHGKQYSGNGLGLAICARIAAAAGGQIWAEAGAERGLAVKIELPE